jgi:hypothetical protein
MKGGLPVTSTNGPSRRQVVLAGLASPIVIALSACAQGGTTVAASSTEPSASEARAHLVSVMQGRGQIADRVVLYRAYWEVMPNVRFDRGPLGVAPFASRALVGTVSRVDKGRGFTSALVEDKEVTTEVGFDSPGAMWRTLHLTLEIAEELGVAEARDASVGIGLAVGEGDDFALLRDGLVGLGTVVLPLFSGSPVFSYDRSLLTIVEDGGLLATVGGDGVLRLPFEADTVRSQQLLIETPTLDDLRQYAARPSRVLPA